MGYQSPHFRFSFFAALIAVSAPCFANLNQLQFEQSMEAFCQPRVTGSFTSNFSQTGFSSKAATANDVAAECTSVQLGATDPNYTAQATPDEAPALYTSMVQLSSNQVSNINQQLSNQRASTRSANGLANATPELRAYYGGVASSELASASRFSLFLSATASDGEQSDTQYETGYEMDANHYTLGLDYRFNSNWLMGAAYGYSTTELHYNQGSDLSESTTNHFIVYGSWYRDNFAVDTSLGYAQGEFDTLRQMPDSEQAVGNTDNDMFYFSIAGSYDFSQGGWVYGPRASFDWLNGNIEGFAESGDSVWAAAFEKQKVESMILAMGGHVSYAASFNWGVLLPYARAELRNEFEDQRDLIVGSFVYDPNSQFSITADSPDTTWAQASLGLTAVFAHGLSAFIDYEQVISYSHTDLARISAGARFEF